MSILMMLVYVGGASVYSEERGFWRGAVWPYFLGEYLARSIIKAGGA